MLSRKQEPNEPIREAGNACVLVEGPRWGDAEFYGQWLLGAAKANDLLKQAKQDNPRFCNEIETLELAEDIDYEIAATLFLAKLANGTFQTFTVDCSSGDLNDFVLMVEMGFFTLTGDRYQMILPANLDLHRVKESHLKLAATDDEDWIHLERLVVTLPCSRAKAYQRLLHDMSEDQRIADRQALLFRD